MSWTRGDARRRRRGAGWISGRLWDRKGDRLSRGIGWWWVVWNRKREGVCLMRVALVCGLLLLAVMAG